MSSFAADSWRVTAPSKGAQLGTSAVLGCSWTEISSFMHISLQSSGKG